MAARRKSVPIAVQATVLALSGRRCAICFGLHHTLRVRQGQIAHLDRNAANAALSNLVFLCLLHHNQYDTRPSQAKGFTPHEVAAYRAALYGEIRSRRLSTSTTRAVRRDTAPRPERPKPLPRGGKAMLLLLWEHGEASFSALTRSLGHAPAYVQYVLESLQAREFVDHYERMGHDEFFLLTQAGRAFVVDQKWVEPPPSRRVPPRETATREASRTSTRRKQSPRRRQQAADEARLLAMRQTQALNPAPLVLSYAPGTRDDRWAGRMVRQHELHRTRLGYVLSAIADS